MKDAIRLIGVRENNLKNITVEIPCRKHTVIAGVSGSGKSTLAYDVIYATAQRKLLDCMSDQERRFGMKMKRPKVESVEGLSTVIGLKQVKPNHNPRSTIGTYTRIGSYVRTLMAAHGRCQCLFCDEIYKQSNFYTLVRDLEGLPPGTLVEVSFPYFFSKRTDRRQQIDAFRQKGKRSIYIHGVKRSLRDFIEVDDETELILVVEGCFEVTDPLNKSAVNCLKSASAQGDHYLSIRLEGGNAGGMQNFYRKHGCAQHHLVTVSLEESDFSYNDMTCACPECMGSGIKKVVHPSKVIRNAKKTLRQGPFFREAYPMSHPYFYMLLYSLAVHYGFSFDQPYEDLPENARNLIMYGSKGETFVLRRPEGYDGALPRYLAKEGELVAFPGVLTRISDRYHEVMDGGTEPSPVEEKFFKTYMHETTCPECHGTRLKKIKNYVTLHGENYASLGKMEFSDLLEFFEGLSGNEMSQWVIDALRERLMLMKEIGLDYLAFERRMDSLSGGEYQRLRMANQVGSGLTGLIYIIDEPTDGLHGADSRKVIAIIQKLLNQGNTVVTIEHNSDVIQAADYIIELGPGAGIHGGEVIARGTLQEIKNHPKSIIGKYLARKPNPIPKNGLPEIDASICLHGVEANNLKNVDVEIPLQKITCFTGVSGSGKSSIVHEVLYKACYSKLQDHRIIPGKYRSIDGIDGIKNIICIDQSLLNGKRTSMAATYLNIFDAIRTHFARSVNEDHRMRDCKAYFSLNAKGACAACKGKGYIENYIQYFGTARMVCPQCRGQQYMDEVLQVRYHGKNIRQVLDMTFAEALAFFGNDQGICDRVRLVCDLGLGYMQLGQSLSSVSGGEAQRLKLAREMSRYKNKKNLLYLFDEPTIGLHSRDVVRIIQVFGRIVANNNTVVLVEHHPDVILNSDYVIDMGPGAGRHGGEVLFSGTPLQLLEQAHSKTAEYLRDYVGFGR